VIFGREADVEQVLAKITKSNVVLIGGKPGVGKTSLAIVVAYKLLEEKKFEKVIFLTGKDTTISLASVLDEIARITSRTDILQAETPEKTQRILTLLRHLPCLIILDNCETISDDSIYTFLYRIPPLSKSILTSRIKHTVPGRQHASVILSGLNPDAIKQLLQQELSDLGIITDISLEVPFLSDIYTITQGIPLIIKLALGRAQEVGASLKQVIDELKDGRSEVLPLLFEKLTTNLGSQSRMLQALIALLSDNTDRDVLRKICKFTEEELGKAIQPLITSYLIDAPVKILVEATPSYSMHPLIRSYATNYLVSQIGLQKIRNLAIDYFKKLVDEQCTHIYLFDPNILEANLKNILILMDYCYSKQRWDDYLAFHKLYYFLGEHGYWSLRSDIALKTIQVSKNMERLDVLAITLSDNWGWLLIQRDVLEEAEKVNKEALTICSEIDDTYSLSNALRHLGLIKHATGKTNEAIPLFEKALAVALENSHHKVSADVYISLGSTLKDSKDIVQAKFFYNKALSYYKLANYETGVGWALGNLGHIARLNSEYNEAKELYAEGLERFTRVNRLDRLAVVHEGLALLEKDFHNFTGAYVHACEAEQQYRDLGMLAKAQKAYELQQEIKKLSAKDKK
jgi:tetratricopeptide (TPR) repeat protein